MGTVFLRGNTWVGEFKYHNRIKRKSLGKKGVITKTEAREMVKQIEGKIKRGEYGMSDPIFTEFSESYISYKRDVEQIRSWERSREAVNHFARFYGDKKLSEIIPSDIDLYKQKRLNEGAKLGTIARELTVICNVFNQAKKWNNFFSQNPVSVSGKPQVQDQKERVLTAIEGRRLLEALLGEYRPIILIALNTGMRLGEILGLQWEWIDLKENLIDLPQTHTKTKTSRRIPINPIVKTLLLERKFRYPGESVFPSESRYSLIGKVRRAFENACKVSGIDKLRFHDLRHSVGTRLGEAGVPIQTISKLLGHTTIRMTQRYVHPEESVKKATDILANFSDSITDKITDTKSNV